MKRFRYNIVDVRGQIRSLIYCTLALLPLSFAGVAQATTTVLSDCIDSLGTPTGAEVKAVCNAQPGCNAATWTYTSGTGTCYYTTSFTPGSEGPYVPVAQPDQTSQDCCGSTTCSALEKSLTVSGSSTAEVSGSFTTTIGTTLAGKINTGLWEVAGELSVENQFKLGASYSSTVDKSKTTAFTTNTPACGKKLYYLVMFEADRPSTGTLTIQLQVACVHATCTPNPSGPVVVKSGTSNLTLDGSQKADKFTECDVECPGPYPSGSGGGGCQSSGTQTQPCNYDSWP